MSQPDPQLWSPRGTLERGPYVVAYLLAWAVSHNLLRLVLRLDFEEVVRALSPLALLTHAPEGLAERVGAFAIVGAFLYLAVVITIRRLRAVGLPPWLAVLAAVPWANVLLFLTLAVAPSKGPEAPLAETRKQRLKALLDRVVPQSASGSAAFGLLVTTVAGGLLTAYSVYAIGQYGWMLFVAVPFVLGVVAALVYGYHTPRNLGGCVTVALLSVSFLGLALFAFAVEGFFCLAMAAPIGWAMAALGGVLGYFLQKVSARGPGTSGTAIALLLMLPLLMGAEAVVPGHPPLIAVRTTVGVAAPPAKVWEHVVSFSELPTPDDPLFRAGIAYPMRAEIRGRGVGAVRHCVFSTGPFVEPITVWDEPRLLKFNVTAQPPAMKEMSPYGAIKAPHLDHFLVSKGGQFLLTALPNGHTRLEGTTWYYHKIWPAAYWQVYSDAIIHAIHLRVLTHIRSRAEGTMAVKSSS
jgi:uncharacterized membrane protein YhaH (DUF805 family)